MKKFLMVAVMALSLLATLIGFGCASLSSYLTPADINQKAVEFVVDAGVADANEFDGWANLRKSVKLDAYVDMAYEVKDTAIKQMRENLVIDYNHLNDIVTRNMEEAQAREEALFADGGAFSTLLTAGGLGAFTGLLGLMRKRPGDLTKEDFDQATVGLRDQIGMKESQFAQVVTGVEKFMKHKDQLTSVLASEDGKTPAQKVDVVLELMRTYLGRAQDMETQKEVAKVKAVV